MSANGQKKRIKGREGCSDSDGGDLEDTAAADSARYKSAPKTLLQTNIATFFTPAIKTPRNNKTTSKRHRITPSSTKQQQTAGPGEPDTPKTTAKSGTAAAASKRNKASTATTQMYLDLGQKTFAQTNVCRICGMLFVHGVAQDLVAHERICRKYTQGVPFPSHSRKKARVVVATAIPVTRRMRNNKKKKDIQGTIVEVRSSDSSSLRKKADEARTIAHQELGFVSNENESGKQNNFLTTFLFVKDNHIVGLVAVEPIARGYPLSVAMLERSRKGRIASMGVHTVWVHVNCRGQGIASRLLDAARSKFVYGVPCLPTDQMAFSSPTAAGIAFATSYLKHEQPDESCAGDSSDAVQLLVYDCCGS